MNLTASRSRLAVALSLVAFAAIASAATSARADAPEEAQPRSLDDRVQADEREIDSLRAGRPAVGQFGEHALRTYFADLDRRIRVAKEALASAEGDDEQAEAAWRVKALTSFRRKERDRLYAEGNGPMIGVGGTLTILGGLATVASAFLAVDYAFSGGFLFDTHPQNESLKIASLTCLGAGATSLAVGIPTLVVGLHREPLHAETSWTPPVAPAAPGAGASLVWRF